VILSAVPADRAGGAAAIEETAYELGGGLGVAVLGSILAGVYSGALPAIGGVGGDDASAAEESIGRAHEVSEHLPSAVGDALMGAARHAFVDGLHAVLVVGIVLMAGSALLAAVALRRTRRAEPARRETVAGHG
jgi:DHA2 family multidrug resistance protein-like MFS transporter